MARFGLAGLCTAGLSARSVVLCGLSTSLVRCSGLTSGLTDGSTSIKLVLTNESSKLLLDSPGVSVFYKNKVKR